MVTATQFDVFRIRGASGAPEFVMVIQDNNLRDLTTRIVAPLARVRNDSAEAMNLASALPSVEVDGVKYLVAVHLLSATHQSELLTFVGHFRSVEHKLKNALDLVFFGI